MRNALPWRRVSALVAAGLALSTGVARAGGLEALSPEAKARVSPQLLAKVEAGASHADGSYSVIVLLQDQETSAPELQSLSFAEHPDRFVREAERMVDAALRRLPEGWFRTSHRYRSFAGFAGHATPEAIRQLAEDPAVKQVVPGARATLHRAEGLALMGVPGARAEGLGGGAGVSVAIIDNGFDYSHPALAGAVLAGYDTGSNDSDPKPDSAEGSHGTEVAGIIAGQDGLGVAPDARLVLLKYTGGASLDDAAAATLAAIDLAVTEGPSLSPPIRVINMSLGFDPLGFYTSDCDGQPNAAPWAAAVNRAVAAGIAVVTSSGNEHKGDSMAIPSCLSGSISVGAVYDANIGPADFGDCADASTAADLVTCYSNSAANLDLLAPGHDCRTTTIGGGYVEDFGGTSAAAPYASGVVALFMARYPGAAVASYATVLKAAGRPIADAGAGGRVTPRVDALATLRLVNGR